METIDEQIKKTKELLEYLRKQKENEKEKEKENKAATEAEPELPKMWIPRIGSDYYTIDSGGNLSTSSVWYADNVDAARYALGNVYKTRDEAEFEVKRRKVERELRKYIYEHGGGNGEFVLGVDNYYMYYDHGYRKLDISSAGYTQLAQIYCNSKEILKDAIEAIGAKRIKIYYLRMTEGLSRYQ